MDEVFSEGTKILFQQGTGWVLFVLTVAVVIYQYNEHKKYQIACNAWKDEQYEKRLTQHMQVVDALNRSTTTLAALQISVEARTEAISHLTTGFAEMARDVEMNRERWADRVTAGEGHLKDLVRRIDEMRIHINNRQGAA